MPAPQDNQAIRKILVIRLGAMGDLLHASAGARWLKQQHPESEIHWLSQPYYTELLSQCENIERVWSIPAKANLRQWWQLGKQLKQEDFDGVINLHPSLKTHLLTWLISPKKKSVYKKQKLKIQGEAQRALSRRHAVEDFALPMASLLKLKPPSLSELRPRLSFSKKMSERPVLENDSDIIGLIIGVGSKRSNRAWDLEGYAELILKLHRKKPHLKFILIGGPDEADLAQALIKLLKGGNNSRPKGLSVENHCQASTITETAHQLAQCQLVIGGDTGPLHLAAAVGTPVISLYGPTSLNRTGPIGAFKNTEQRIIDLMPPAELACWPCEKTLCPLEGEQHLACMSKTRTESVLDACLKLLLA